jgi:hypothetical protein
LVISLQDAVAILNKWKDESSNILVVAESPFRQTVRGIEGLGVRWAMGQHVRVSQVLFSIEEKASKGIVEFEGHDGNFLRLAIGHCRIVYGDPREASPENRAEAEATTASALSIFFPDEECFHFYELREAT